MIDWIELHDPATVFVEGEERAHTYGEIAARIRRGQTAGPRVIRPRPTVDSIVDLLAAMSSGTAVVLGPEAPEPGALDAAGAASVIFTSGTTSRAKGVRLTEANWAAAARASASHLDHTPADTWLLAMPLHHVAGLSIVLRTAWVGARLRLAPRFDPASFTAALEEGVTMASVVPTMLSRLLDAFPGPYRGQKAVLVGGGPIPDGLLERAAAAGLPVLPTYGLTETCGQVATLRPGSPLEHKAHPLPGVDLRIGKGGRIEVRGGMVFPGYLGEPDRVPNDWFVTGDLGSLDRDGALRVVGRADDVIITGGENVSPAAVETALLEHAAVSRVLVVGLPSPEWGMEVGCLYAGEVDPAEIESWARDRLARFMVPRRWLRLDSLPVTALGKPDRATARQLLLDRT